jgi:hypothetical protein
MRHKSVLAAICVVIGGLQAWDSGVLGTARGVQLLVVLAIAIPAAALLTTERYGPRAAAVSVSFVLLTIARITSPIALPTLHIVAVIPAMVILFAKMVDAGGSPQPSARGSQR